MTRLQVPARRAPASAVQVWRAHGDTAPHSPLTRPGRSAPHKRPPAQAAAQSTSPLPAKEGGPGARGPGFPGVRRAPKGPKGLLLGVVAFTPSWNPGGCSRQVPMASSGVRPRACALRGWALPTSKWGAGWRHSASGETFLFHRRKRERENVPLRRGHQDSRIRNAATRAGVATQGRPAHARGRQPAPRSTGSA